MAIVFIDDDIRILIDDLKSRDLDVESSDLLYAHILKINKRLQQKEEIQN